MATLLLGPGHGSDRVLRIGEAKMFSHITVGVSDLERGYFGAYLRDPDGNKLHIVHRPEFS